MRKAGKLSTRWSRSRASILANQASKRYGGCIDIASSINGGIWWGWGEDQTNVLVLYPVQL